MTINRLLVLDPSLITVLSHNYSEARALAREADQLGLTAEIFCHRDAQTPVREIPATPLFQQHGYGHLEDSRPAADFMAMTFCNTATLKDLRLLSAALEADDFVLFPTITCNIVLAICQWIEQLIAASAGTPRFGMCLMFPPHTNAAGRPSPVAENTYRQAFSLLSSRAVERIQFTCEVDAVGELFEPMLGTRPLTLPIPTWATAAESPARHDAAEVRIGYLGGAREEKGFHLLPQIVREIRSRRPETQFTIQAMGYDAAFVAPIADELSGLQDSHVTVIRGPIGDQQMSEAMRSCRLLLLPYDARRYDTRGSSLYTEAKRVGVPMVLPADTTFGEEGASKGIAETFSRFSGDEIVAATLRALERLDQLTERSLREAKATRIAGVGYVQPLLAAQPSSA